ncbi:MAG: flagellar biosynthesis protein FliQ [bacterium]|nr:flagellar biosynthesis protein FliQ [bacterium]
MPPADALDIARTAISVVLKIGAPLMLSALTVGLIVSFFQALTQIQEMTLSFIPKILTLFCVLLLLIPYISSTLSTFTLQIFDQIARLGS